MKEILPTIFVVLLLTGAITYSLVKRGTELSAKENQCVSRTRVESLETCNNYYCWYTVFGGKRVRVRMEKEPYSDGDYICDELLNIN